MKRDMSFTMVLMASSIAAAVASPELPTDLAKVGCVEPAVVAVAAPTLSVTTARHDAAPKPDVRSDKLRPVATNACDIDVTAPYRRLHHGSMKLDPACVAQASI